MRIYGGRKHPTRPSVILLAVGAYNLRGGLPPFLCQFAYLMHVT